MLIHIWLASALLLRCIKCLALLYNNMIRVFYSHKNVIQSEDISNPYSNMIWNRLLADSETTFQSSRTIEPCSSCDFFPVHLCSGFPFISTLVSCVLLSQVHLRRYPPCYVFPFPIWNHLDLIIASLGDNHYPAERRRKPNRWLSTGSNENYSFHIWLSQKRQ